MAKRRLTDEELSERGVKELGWDTESVGGVHPTQYRAISGSLATDWCNSWAEVLQIVRKLPYRGIKQHATA